jgi:excisionase family DNA binding protein
MRSGLANGDRKPRFEIETLEAEMKAQNDDALLTPAEVAALFRVDPKTVTRWAKAGKLSSIRTLGGHRRYRADEVKKFLEGAMQSPGR